MSERQIVLNLVIHKAILIMSIVWSCMALNFVYAEGQSYIYVSDIIKGKNNDIEMEKQNYKHETPLTFQNKLNRYQSEYRSVLKHQSMDWLWLINRIPLIVLKHPYH